MYVCFFYTIKDSVKNSEIWPSAPTPKSGLASQTENMASLAYFQDVNYQYILRKYGISSPTVYKIRDVAV